MTDPTASMESTYDGERVVIRLSGEIDLSNVEDAWRHKSNEPSRMSRTSSSTSPRSTSSTAEDFDS